MFSICRHFWILLLIAFYCHGNENEFSNEENGSKIKRRLFRREVRPKISVINKSGGIVNLYYMDTRYHRRRYFAKLRENEKTGIRSSIGTTWLAYNVKDEPLYLNTRYNFLVLRQHANRKNNVIVTTSKRSTKISKVAPSKSSPYFVEVLVVADSSLYRHYRNKENIIRYIKVLIQTTNQIFADKSINVKLHIVVTKTELYTRNVASLNFPTRNPGQAISMVCKHLYKRQRVLNKNIDFGIVLTRRQFGYAGFTPLYQMCEKSRSCTLVRDNGLQTAFVLAHEIGHALGMSHDGDLNDCIKNEIKGSVMGRTVYSKFSNYHWSNCSRIQLSQNIRNFKCLRNRPREFKGVDKKLPGEYFDIDDQCKFTFGPGYSNCLKIGSENRQCRFLYCRIPNRSRNLCSFMNVAPVDGTKCADNRWCIRGKCLPYGASRPKPIDGNWSSWTAWSQCTHTCNKGLRKRKRACTNPKPEYNGQNCSGISIQWDVCTEKPCETELTHDDRRDYFCYGIHGEGWKYFSTKASSKSFNNSSMDCDFENDLCDWKNSGSSSVMWKRNNGSTVTKDTGPDFDYTYRNVSGHYVYMESSHPMLRDESVKLTSQVISTPEVCLHFAYHMRGQRLGVLKVNVLTEEQDKPLTIWEKVRHQSSSWLTASVSITFEKPFIIEIEAIRGSSYFSDIAIDNIRVVRGLCTNNGSQLNPCNLPCYKEKEKKYKLENIVPTGEKCYSHSHDMCIDGKCQAIGCDGVFNSTKEIDQCGKCDGVNSTCFHTDGVLQVSSTELDHVVLKFPKHLMNIIVEKLSSTPASLALVNPSKRSKTFYQSAPSFYRYYYFKMADASARYFVQNKTQKVFIDGKISEDLHIELSHPDSTYNISATISIKFSFVASYNTKGFVLRIQRWTNCSGLCNGGTEDAIYACVDLATNKTTEMSKCLMEGVKLMNKTRSCNEEKCKVSYSVSMSGWSTCSRCGKVGFRKRSVQCMRNKEGESPTEVSMEFCKAYPRYPKIVKCFTRCVVPRERPCIERSKACPRMFAKGYCKYSNVRSLCCNTCKAQTVPR